MTPTISSLLSRVRAASGPDRELDLDIARALVPDVIVLRWNKETNQNEAFTHWRYTESIDAAVALVERVLPDANTVGVEKNPKGATGYVARNYVHSGHWMHEADAATPPIAILAALLSALEQKESTG